MSEETKSKFEKAVRQFSDEQLAAAKSTVDAVLGERTPPDVGSMSDNEFEKYKRDVIRKAEANK